MQSGAEARRPNHFSNDRVAVEGNPVSVVSCFRRFVGNPSFTQIMEGLHCRASPDLDSQGLRRFDFSLECSKR